MTIDDFIEECRAKNVPITVVDAPPIAIDPKATTAELLREEEALRWHIAEAQEFWGRSEVNAMAIEALCEPDLRHIRKELHRREILRGQPMAPPWPTVDPDKRDEWDEVKRRTDIQDLAREVLPPYGSEGVRQKNSGAVVYSCWNHTDKTPSLFVFDDGHFHCFGCHAHGDVIDLARGALQLSSFQAAMAFLAARCGLDRPAPKTIAVKTGDQITEVPIE